MNKWVLICPPLAIFVIGAALVSWGFSLATALLIALILVCPALIVWGIIEAGRGLELPLEPIPQTRGMTMNWAAPFYDWYCPRLGFGRGFRDQTLRFLALRTGEHLLDAGCGTGVVTRLAAEAVGPTGLAVGVDAAAKMIAKSRANATLTASRAEFRLAAIEHLPFGDASFDAAVTSLMLHHLPPVTKAEGLREVQRVLKPGGRLLAVDIDRPANLLWWLAVWPLLAMPETRSNLTGGIPRFLRAAGFSNVEVLGRWGGWLTFWRGTKPAS